MNDIIITKFCHVHQLRRNKGEGIYWESRSHSGIVWILRGSILFKFKDKELICEKNDAIFISKNTEYHAYYPEDTCFIGFNFHTNETTETIKKISDVNLYKNFKIIQSHFLFSPKQKNTLFYQNYTKYWRNFQTKEKQINTIIL